MNSQRLLGAAAAGALVVGFAGHAAAAGFYVQEQSPRGLGRAYSGEGADTGSASLWWNPAAIAGVSGQGDAFVGVNFVNVDASVRDTGSTIQRPTLPALPVGGASSQKDPIDNGTIPNLGASWRLNDQLVLGVAVTAPFNFSTRYPLNSFVRYQALKSDLTNLDVQPTLAWRPTPMIDVGVGFDASYVRATLSNALPNLSPLLPDASSNLTGHGWDYGWVVGVDLHPTDQLTVGASYRSHINHSLAGQVTVAGLLGPAAAANVSTGGVAQFTTPAIMTGTVRFKATDRLTLDAQVQHFGWGAFQSIVVNYGGQTQTTPQNYRDTTSAAVGGDYMLNPQWTLRAGVQRDPTPTPDIGRTARVPDSGRWLVGFGTTYTPTPRMSVDLGVAHISFDDTKINSSATAFGGTPIQTPITESGAVSGQGWVFSAGLRVAL